MLLTLVSGFSRETLLIDRHIYVCVGMYSMYGEIYFKELAHVIVGTGKSETHWAGLRSGLCQAS